MQQAGRAGRGRHVLGGGRTDRDGRLRNRARSRRAGRRGKPEGGFQTSAATAILLDPSSDSILYEKNSDQPVGRRASPS